MRYCILFIQAFKEFPDAIISSWFNDLLFGSVSFCVLCEGLMITQESLAIHTQEQKEFLAQYFDDPFRCPHCYAQLGRKGKTERKETSRILANLQK